MTAQSDAEAIRRGYEAFGKGDIPAVAELLADDVVWHISGRSELAGTYRGRDAVIGFFTEIAQRSEGSFRLDIHDLLASDEHVVAIVTELAHRGDRVLNAQGTHVWHVRDGKAAEFWGLSADAYAQDEFWA
jgi:ketosteroid isomerase-like protein